MTHLSVLDREENESAARLLEEWLVLLLALQITHETRPVLLDGFELQLLNGGLGGLSLSSGSFQLGEHIGSGSDGFGGGVEGDGG